ncbi:MAG: glycerol-3-phosphate acyltransferase [Rhodospirillales bacterium RIFCSPLOWO2_12_FULL_58_28]|nr:MAG: glycerol-3-phosphate acyltransferase [Rhodospirillales bacterium RIFCSPLOWO2_02_FULL_58_16]OHC76943.1 MAG: glycerol-3-phosphate acyltransferase [Rhodospirillales bacterium RIFCSPLOWO2_12_FULL_58_28]
MGEGELSWLQAAAAAVGYLVGSIPFGLVLTRVAGLGDIRAVGSGNIGATNVLRTGHKGLAAATLLLDAGKAAAAALLFARVDGMSGLIAGFFAVLGHNFPLWLNFKGGKGVASTLGLFIAVAWPAGLLVGATWLATAALFRVSSLAALAALALSPLYMHWIAPGPPTVMAAGLAVLGIARHHQNIKRLLKGEEPKIGGGKK